MSQDENQQKAVYPNQVNNLDILYIASTRWDFLWQRPQQIAARLSQNNRVLFFNHSIGMNYDEIVEIVNNPILLEERLTKVNDQLWVFSSFHLKNHYRVHNISPQEFNSKVKYECINFLLTKLNFYNTVVITNLPNSLDYLEKVSKDLLCYDCLDSHSSFSWSDNDIDAKEKALATQSDIVTASALSLFENMKEINPCTFLLPNAVDFEHFYQAKVKRILIKKKNKQPIIGFVGAFYEWIDQPLIRYVAKSKPNWRIEIIGPQQFNIPNHLHHIKNIKFSGTESYKKLPKAMAKFDVCIIPFKINNTTLSTNPIKMWEYMATGIPIVSTSIPEANNLKEIIYIGENNRHFLSQIEKALREPDQKRLSAGILVAKENDWNHRVQTLLQLIYSALAKHK